MFGFSVLVNPFGRVLGFALLHFLFALCGNETQPLVHKGKTHLATGNWDSKNQLLVNFLLLSSGIHLLMCHLFRHCKFYSQEKRNVFFNFQKVLIFSSFLFAVSFLRFLRCLAYMNFKMIGCNHNPKTDKFWFRLKWRNVKIMHQIQAFAVRFDKAMIAKTSFKKRFPFTELNFQRKKNPIANMFFCGVWLIKKPTFGVLVCLEKQD